MARPVALSHGLKTRTLPYEDALRSAGLDVIHFTTAQRGSLDGVFGLVLCGGTDIESSRYGQLPYPETDPQPDRDRDDLELALTEHALRRDLPILAICRGMQLLNVALGGSLHQHIAGHRLTSMHGIHVSEASRLHIIASLRSYQVNSRHHQAVDRVGDSLRAIAWAPEGYVEAIERPDRSFVVGVQWHPEDCVATSDPDARLFAAFRQAVFAPA